MTHRIKQGIRFHGIADLSQTRIEEQIRMDDQAITKTLLPAEERDQPETEYEQPPSSASGPSRVFWMVAPLVVLAFIESFSFGILSPMLSIVQTEVMQDCIQ